MPSSSGFHIKKEHSPSPLYNATGLTYKSVTPDFQSQRDVEKYRELREEERRCCLVSSGSNTQAWGDVKGKHTAKENKEELLVEDSDPGTRSSSPPAPSQRDAVRHRKLRNEENQHFLVPSGSNIQNNALKHTEKKRRNKPVHLNKEAGPSKLKRKRDVSRESEAQDEHRPEKKVNQSPRTLKMILPEDVHSVELSIRFCSNDE